MIDSLSIKNFRGIRSCSIEKFNQINVFFGKNNCGKSSLLEAIFLLSGFSNPQLITNINRYRNYNNMTEDDLKLFFYNLQAEGSSKIKISGSIKNIVRNLDISLLNSNTILEKTIPDNSIPSPISSSINFKKGLKFNFSVSNGSKKNYLSELTLIPMPLQTVNNVQYTIDKKYDENILGMYLPPIYTNIMPTRDLESIIVNKKQQSIIGVLKKVDSRIEDIKVINGVIMVDIGLKRLVPINILGDGIRKLVYILVSINYLALLKNDGLIILIDEIENGLHYSSMAPLWREIFEITIEKNIQIFIATHSMDCMKGLVEALSNKKEWQEKLSTFSLVHKEDGELKAIASNYEQYEYSIEQGMEIR